MKAISLRQPWASLAAFGLRTIETRTWLTKHRGAMLIHASQTKPDWNGVVWGKWDEAKVRQFLPMPLGQALAVTDLLGCRLMKDTDTEAAMCEPYRHAIAWLLGYTKPILPFPIKGQLGLWNCERDLVYGPSLGGTAKFLRESLRESTDG